jgi:hypothetical protein
LEDISHETHPYALFASSQMSHGAIAKRLAKSALCSYYQNDTINYVMQHGPVSKR